MQDGDKIYLTTPRECKFETLGNSQNVVQMSPPHRFEKRLHKLLSSFFLPMMEKNSLSIRNLS